MMRADETTRLQRSHAGELCGHLVTRRGDHMLAPLPQRHYLLAEGSLLTDGDVV
jgi:hypothetical protein